MDFKGEVARLKKLEAKYKRLDKQAKAAKTERDAGQEALRRGLEDHAEANGVEPSVLVDGYYYTAEEKEGLECIDSLRLTQKLASLEAWECIGAPKLAPVREMLDAGTLTPAERKAVKKFLITKTVPRLSVRKKGK